MKDVVQITKPEANGITLTEAAKQHIQTYLQKNPGHAGIRLSVKKTGCSGLSYVIDFLDIIEETDHVFPQEGGFNVCITKSSYPFLKGIGIDYVQQGLNSKFMFTNPNQSGECGCGESFTVDS